MKSLLHLILLGSMTTAIATHAEQPNHIAFQKNIDWDDEAALDELFAKFIDHYEKNGPKAIFHTLYEEGYKSTPDLLGITILSSLEKFAFDYLDENPGALDQYLTELENNIPQDSDVDLSQILETLINKLHEQAHRVHLIIDESTLGALAVLQISMQRHTIDQISLFKDIVTYAVQNICS